MNSLCNRFFVLLTLTVGFAGAPLFAAATSLSATEEIAVRAVVVAQLEALADEDADSAFATATPSVREAIVEPGRFLAMVRGAYPMVFRPAAVAFLKPVEDAGAVMQMVQLTDNNDKRWLVLFALERQPDASWRIAGCLVTENTWHPA